MYKDSLILVCSPGAGGSSLCPEGYRLEVLELGSLSEVFVPSFSSLSSSSVFFTVFLFTLSSYLLARSFGTIIGLIR